MENTQKASTLDRRWYHPVCYAGHHEHFTRRMCIEQLCAHAVDNYTTEYDEHCFSVISRDGSFSFSFLNAEEYQFFLSRLALYRRLRAGGGDPVEAYRRVPEYRESHHALVLDQPDTFTELPPL